MKRTHALLAVALVGAASAATVASAEPGVPNARSSSAATVQLRHTRLGSILVSSSGQTLYEFTRDRADKSSCVTIRGCSAIWPSLKSRRPTAGSGVKSSLLGTSTGQVTYAGHPLYTYTGDHGAGETAYVGAKTFGGTWYAVNASGGAVK